jgi:hypothetical protein
VGGRIELANGEVRGAVRNRSSDFIGSGVDLAHPNRSVDGYMGNDIGT